MYDSNAPGTRSGLVAYRINERVQEMATHLDLLMNCMFTGLRVI